MPFPLVFGRSHRSLPVLGAWIEISGQTVPRGSCLRRSPCGERGLKYLGGNPFTLRRKSLPVRGAWIEIRFFDLFFRPLPSSLPVRGAWIEISMRRFRNARSCRSPCGERGLKLRHKFRAQVGGSRSPCGERGLKSSERYVEHGRLRRSPCGERGLKSPAPPEPVGHVLSLPVRGAWIEILALWRF